MASINDSGHRSHFGSRYLILAGALARAFSLGSRVRFLPRLAIVRELQSTTAARVGSQLFRLPCVGFAAGALTDCLNFFFNTLVITMVPRCRAPHLEGGDIQQFLWAPWQLGSMYLIAADALARAFASGRGFECCRCRPVRGGCRARKVRA